MTEILLRIKPGSDRQFLTTPSGYTINQDHWERVDDDDRNIQAYLHNRSDLEFKDVPEDQDSEPEPELEPEPEQSDPESEQDDPESEQETEPEETKTMEEPQEEQTNQEGAPVEGAIDEGHVEETITDSPSEKTFKE